MILEQIFLLAIIVSGFILFLDYLLTPKLARKFLKFIRYIFPVLIVIFCIREFGFEARWLGRVFLATFYTTAGRPLLATSGWPWRCRFRL